MKQTIIILLLMLLGLFSIVIKQNLGQVHWLFPYLSELSSILLVSGVLTFLYRVFMDREVYDQLKQLFHIHDSIIDGGLNEVLPESQDFNFARLIEKNQTLSIVMNDGMRWIGNNAVRLRERFNKSGLLTEIFTVDPERCFLKCLSEKTQVTQDELKEKINGSWKRLKVMFEESEKRGILKIYALKNYPTISIFLTEDESVITLYQVSSGRTNVPLFEINKVNNNKSLFEFLKKDVDTLRSESRLYFDSSMS